MFFTSFINTAFEVSNLSPTTSKSNSFKFSLVACDPLTPLSRLWLCAIVTKFTPEFFTALANSIGAILSLYVPSNIPVSIVPIIMSASSINPETLLNIYEKS